LHDGGLAIVEDVESFFESGTGDDQLLEDDIIWLTGSRQRDCIVCRRDGKPVRVLQVGKVGGQRIRNVPVEKSVDIAERPVGMQDAER
jgi:hypothetical protein